MWNKVCKSIDKNRRQKRNEKQCSQTDDNKWFNILQDRPNFQWIESDAAVSHLSYQSSLRSA